MMVSKSLEKNILIHFINQSDFIVSLVIGNIPKCPYTDQLLIDC